MRLFVSIPLPQAIKDRLGPLCRGLPGAKWADVAQMHITLRFIGEADGVTAADIRGALAEVRAPSFEVELAGIGDFGSRKRLRALWVGVAENPALSQLRTRVSHAVDGVTGEAERRKFHAHVTLARFKRANPDLGAYLSQHEPFRTGPFLANEFVLFSSHLGSDGAIHTPEARYPLIAPHSL